MFDFIGFIQRWPMPSIRFGMKPLLLAVAAIGVIFFAINSGIRYSRARQAQENYEHIDASYKVEAALPTDVARASSDWLTAELDIPWCNATMATKRHAQRIASLLIEEQQLLTGGAYDGNYAYRRTLGKSIELIFRKSIEQLRRDGESEYASSLERNVYRADFEEPSLPKP